MAVRLSAQIRGHERHFPKGVFLCLQRCQARCGRVLGAPPSSRGRVSGFGRFSVTKRDLEGEDFFVLKPKRDLEGDVGSYIYGRRLLERAARRPAATVSCLHLHALPHRHPLRHHSGSARGRHGLGRAITRHYAGAMLLSKHPQRPAAGSSPAQADARQGLLHGRALLLSQGLEEVRRRSCHCILLPWLQLCLDRLTPISHVVWCCSLFMHSLQVLAFCLTAFRHAGAFGKSKNRKWPLNGV